MPFNIGETVGTYRIVEQLGQGGMATVYKAYHPSLDRFVAIKVLHPAFKDDETFYLRFQREAQVVARMEHPAIVPVYDFATHNSEPYIVMKFIEGQTLKHRMKRKPLTLDETIQTMEAIAAGLDYAHRQNVLHRDIKPSNVMVDKDEIPYLADFGLARIASSGESTMSHDVLIGTPNYISPEQARGDKTLGPGTDIYSLGIMLYEIVVGRVPFSADTPYAVVHDHIYKPLPLPSHVNPTVPKLVELVLLKALAKVPEDRYQTAGEMIIAFKDAVTASDMNELSATEIRLDRLSTPAPTHSTEPTQLDTSRTVTPATEDIASMVKAAVADALATEQRTPAPAIPGVIPPHITPPYIHRREYQQSRRGFWVLSGVAALVFICIASLAVMISAGRNDIVQHNPALANADENTVNTMPTDVQELVEYFQVDSDMSLEDSVAWVEAEPDNPSARLTLTLNQAEAGMFTAALENLTVLMNNPDTTGDVLAEAATELATRGFDEMAIKLWFAAYSRSPEDPTVRNGAGQYIYRQFNNLPVADLTELQDTLVTEDADAFQLTMMARALIASDPIAQEIRDRQARRFLDQALEINDAFAEAHLVYGDYYAEQGEIESAIESWRFAGSFSDSPEWVQQEALVKITRYQNEGS